MDVDKIGVTLTDENFQTVVLESPRPVLVAFWAEGCGPWHLLVPDMAALAEACHGQATVATLDVEAQPRHPSAMGFRPSRPSSSFRMVRLWMRASGWWTGPT